jgi:hypothetical protein
MKRHQNRAHQIFVATALLLAACSDATFPTSRRNNGQTPHSDDANLVEQPLEPVTSLELDGEAFRITPLRIGMQSFMSGEIPMLSYVMPPKANYVEILRCSADTIIRGSFDTINDVDLGSPSLSTEIAIFQENNFWRAAAEQGDHCILVARGFTGKVFLDKSADSGSYRYLMRPCVNPDRIKTQSEDATKVCSRQVAFSELLSEFQNRRVQTEKEALSRAQKFQDKVDGLGREIYFLARDLNNALAKCQKEESNRQKRVGRKNALAEILGIGVTLGMELTMPASGIQAVQAGTKTWMQLWTETWNTRDTIAGNGKQLAGIFKLLFTSANDFPKACNEAKEISSKSEIKVSELKTTHRELAQALDEAEIARKARVAGE